MLTLTLLASCDGVDTDDPCDRSTADPAINASIMLSVIVEEPSGFAIDGQEVIAEIYKVPCGAEKKGLLTSNGYTGSNGIYNALNANYQMRNHADKIVVTVEAPGLNNDNSNDIITRNYGTGHFNSGQILFLDITMIRDH